MTWPRFVQFFNMESCNSNLQFPDSFCVQYANIFPQADKFIVQLFSTGCIKEFLSNYGLKSDCLKNYFCFLLLKSLYISLVKYSHVFIRYVIQLNHFEEIIHPACLTKDWPAKKVTIYFPIFYLVKSSENI